jgi:hypothetical protein
MRKWLTVLVLMAAMLGGVLAGTPLPIHSGEGECPMMGMMDCCTKAQKSDDAPEAGAARLCCALNCSGPSRTTPAGAFNFSPPVAALQNAVIPHHVLHLNPGPARSNSPPGLQTHSTPSYIRHLALLI